MRKDLKSDIWAVVCSIINIFEVFYHLTIVCHWVSCEAPSLSVRFVFDPWKFVFVWFLPGKAFTFFFFFN